MVGTALCGHTKDIKHSRRRAFDLCRQLLSEVDIPVILEGRVHKPEHVRRAFDLGVYAVVVGTAITDFEWLSRRFIEVCPNLARGNGRQLSSRRIASQHMTSRGKKGT